MRAIFAPLALAATLLLTTACKGGTSAPTVTPTATATGTSVATATIAPPPTATSTPDPLGPPPRTATDALATLTRYFAAATVPQACPFAALFAAWQAQCSEGDLDRDDRPDMAFLVPLAGGRGRSPAPAAVIVRPAAGPLIVFPAGGSDADASPLGRAFYGIGDWAGSGEQSLAFITTECGASNCVSRVEIQRWDGTAWRNIGPGGDFDNIKSVGISRAGGGARLIVVAGTLGSVGAGPTRNTTATFGIVANVFSLLSAVPEKPKYLRHAIQDADALFQSGDFPAAAKAYRAAIADRELLDWQKERNLPPGRPRLTGYALFRIAVATAASGADASPAIDAAITTGEELLFVEAVQAFRRGMQERDGVHGGCVEATRYLSDPIARDILRAVFDYGFANPAPSYLDICPL